jgi:methyltransferase
MFIPIATLIAVAAMMLAELWLSRSNEQWMFDHGAIAAPDPVYSTMKWAYPAAFIAMAAEGVIVGGPSEGAAIAGVILLVLAKAVKFWAIASLGKRWTYRVLVMPGTPLVAGGPYRVIRHPNYVGVVGELIAMALLSGARITGVLGVIGFGWLLIQRIGAEERALGLRTGA